MRLIFNKVIYLFFFQSEWASWFQSAKYELLLLLNEQVGSFKYQINELLFGFNHCKVHSFKGKKKKKKTMAAKKHKTQIKKYFFWIIKTSLQNSL